MRSFSTLSIAAFLFLSSLSAWANDQPKLGKFSVGGTQYSLLAKAFWERFLHSGAGFRSCVRRLYTTPELIKHPLPKEDFGVLRFFKKAMTSDEKNTFSILNSSLENWHCEIKGGYCMGLTALNRDMNLLLVFDPKKSKMKLPKFANDQEKSTFFENLLYDVWATRRPSFVPGFKNMNEFTSDPIIRNIFLASIPKNWADLASIPDIALGVLAKSRRHLTEAETIEEIGLLKAAVEKGYNPVMFLGGVEVPEALRTFRGAPHGARMSSENARKTVGMDVMPSEEEIKALMKKHETKTVGGSPNAAPQAMIGDAIEAIEDQDHTYIHVCQVTSFEQVGSRKWILKVIDPNGIAPANVGTLTVDLDAAQPIYFEGATLSLELKSFGELPGDRAHVDEILSNLILFSKKNPDVFTKIDALK